MEKNIHFVLLGPDRPPFAVSCMERFGSLNPGWRVWVHEGLFSVPSEYEEALETASTVGEQSDVLRLAALELWGGWYFDWDVYPVKPVEAVEELAGLGDKLLLGPVMGTGRAGTAICAASKASVIWPAVRKRMLEIAREGTAHGTTFERTLADAMTTYHADQVVVGTENEFCLRGTILYNRVSFKKMVDGTFMGDTGRTVFVHGWVGASRRPVKEKPSCLIQ